MDIERKEIALRWKLNYEIHIGISVLKKKGGKCIMERKILYSRDMSGSREL